MSPKFRKAAAILSMAAASAGCESEECRAELGACLTGSIQVTLEVEGHTIMGDVRILLDDVTTNLNMPAASVRLSALSSPHCFRREGDVYYSDEKTVAEGIVNKGSEVSFPVEDREYRISAIDIVDGSAVLGIEVLCPSDERQ